MKIGTIEASDWALAMWAMPVRNAVVVIFEVISSQQSAIIRYYIGV